MMRSGEEFDEIMKNIELRRSYVNKYFTMFDTKPQWIRKDDNDCDDAPDFEEWMKAEMRAEKINNLLNEED